MPQCNSFLCVLTLKNLVSNLTKYIESVFQKGKNPQALRAQSHPACFNPRLQFNKVAGHADPRSCRLPAPTLHLLSFLLDGQKTVR